MDMIIGGKKRGAGDGKTVPIVNPATGATIGTMPAATARDVTEALEHAREGFPVWSAVPLHERARIFNSFVLRAERERGDLARIISRELGKPVRDAEGELDSIPDMFLGYAEKAKHLCGLTLPRGAEKGIEEDFAVTIREPLGVVACIIPFNFPVDLLCHKVAPALIMGNTVIVKPASANPSAAARVVELLLESGVPADAVQLVTGSGAVVGRLLAESPLINAISFTGSTKVALDIAARASANMTRTFLECGGNDAMIVCEDADLDLSVENLMRARANCAGQVCCATKRIIVHNAVKEKLAKKLAEGLAKLKIGDPMDRSTDMGCLVSEAAAAEVEEQVAKAVKSGAKCLIGGKRKGSFFDPTILMGVTPEMDIAQDLEVFGPIFPFIGFDSLADAIRIANNTRYGLQGAVMTANMNTAMKVASQMQCGAVIVNGSSRYRSAEMPFGGYKLSGLGREGISHTLEEMSQVKTIVLKKVFH